MFQIPIQPVLLFLLVLIRVLFFFAFMPVFGEVFTPVRVRMLVGVTVAFVFTPLLAPSAATAFPQSVGQFLYVLAPEALLGMACGLVGRILFAAFQFAGQIMGEEIGFGMAAAVDPAQAAGQIPIVAETMYIVSLMIFFAVDAHHFFFAALARSFEQAPPGALGFSTGLAQFFTEKASRMFFIAVQMSLPVLVVSFVTNIAMGMVAKAVPQLNVFMESFPIRIIVGLVVLGSIMVFVVKMMTGLFAGLPADLSRILGLMAR